MLFFAFNQLCSYAVCSIYKKLFFALNALARARIMDWSTPTDKPQNRAKPRTAPLITIFYSVLPFLFLNMFIGRTVYKRGF